MFENLTTLEEIASKKAEYRSRIAEAADEQLDGLTQELSELEKRENEIRAELATKEKRNALIEQLSGGSKPAAATVNPTRAAEKELSLEETLASPEYRSAFAKTLMRRKLTAAEQRALNTVITTTATTAVDATETVDGQNNGGLFIPTDMDLSLMTYLSEISPIYKDIKKTSIKGVVKFPYKKSNGSVTRKGASKELTSNENAVIVWETLELKTAEISITIPVTWKLEAMAVNQFYDYLITEIKEQMSDSVINGAIYGSGDDDMSGITTNAQKLTYSGTVLDAMEANIGKLTSKQKIGAKWYVSSTAAESIQFAKDSDGRYLFPINGGLPKTIAGYALEVDPYLKDGDIVFGNINRYARLNINEGMSIVKEVKGTQRRNEYTAYELVSSAAQPDTLLYIAKA